MLGGSVILYGKWCSVVLRWVSHNEMYSSFNFFKYNSFELPTRKFVIELAHVRDMQGSIHIMRDSK